MDPIESVDIDTAEAVADAFRHLGDATRVSIILALARAEHREEDPVSFAELRHRVGVRDSGRFNYHLDQLQPRFIVRTDNGYRIRHAGRAAHGFIRAGAAPSDTVERSGPVDRDCPLCTEQLECSYEADTVVLRCPTHDMVMTIPVPPSVAQSRSLGALVRAAETAAEVDLLAARRGQCDDCWGSMSVVMQAVDHPTDPEDDLIAVRYTCDDCEQHLTMPLKLYFAEAPAVAGRLVDDDLDLDSMGLLERIEHLEVITSQLTDDGGRITYQVGDEQLTIRFDETANVVEVASTDPST